MIILVIGSHMDVVFIKCGVAVSLILHLCLYPCLPFCHSVLFFKRPHKPLFYLRYCEPSCLFFHIFLSLLHNLFILTQACQNGNSQHLEHLLFYGADSSSQNASGNTALHICALYNKVDALFHKTIVEENLVRCKPRQ